MNLVVVLVGAMPIFRHPKTHLPLRTRFAQEDRWFGERTQLRRGHCFDSIGIEIGFDFGSESKNMFANFVVVLLDRSRGDFVGGSNREIDPFFPGSIVGVQSSEETWLAATVSMSGHEQKKQRKLAGAS